MCSSLGFRFSHMRLAFMFTAPAFSKITELSSLGVASVAVLTAVTKYLTEPLREERFILTRGSVMAGRAWQWE